MKVMDVTSNPVERRIRVAYGSVPKDSGTFTFYSNIRTALLEHNVEMFCVTVGHAQNRLWDDAFSDDLCVRLAENSRSLKRQAQAFVNWCVREDINIAIGINSEGILSALPHLPTEIRAMSRCANAFDHGYRITMSGHERLAKIIALTPRLRDDLISSYGADPSDVVLIPNCVNHRKFQAAAQQPRGTENQLQLGFLGRLEHTQKGVMHIPKIVDALHERGVDFRLRIAGKGKDGDAMIDAMQAHIDADRVQFLGSLTPDEIPAFLGQTDVFIFTSHFEGCPNALLEAMMAGSVPVSWIIKGITDFLIDHDQTGFLCESADICAFADHIAALASNRERVSEVSRATASAACERFSQEAAAQSYAKVFHEIMALPAPAVDPLPWSSFKPDPNFPPAWRQYIPDRGKKFLRMVLK